MNLGQISALLAWGATAAYAIALVAFAMDLARLADARGRRRVAVPAGAVVGGGVAAGTDVVVDGDVADGGAPDGTGRLGTDLPAGAMATVRRRALGIAMAVTAVGFLLHAASVVTRGVAAGRVPWANMYEFTLVATFAAVATFLVLSRKRDVAYLGTFVIGVSTIALGLGLRAFYVPAVGVEPILQSPWLIIHVSIAIVATGLFTVACAASVLQLLKSARESRFAAGADAGLGGHRWRVLDAMPPVRELEAVSFRVNAVAFVLWTFTVMAGALWAEVAWGRYWGWDPKEVWSFVIWVIYAAYLHARTTRGWAGTRAAWFVVVGYAAVIFNFTVVNLLIPGNHSYSGL